MNYSQIPEQYQPMLKKITFDLLRQAKCIYAVIKELGCEEYVAEGEDVRIIIHSKEWEDA